MHTWSLSCTHGNRNCKRGYHLPLISNIWEYVIKGGTEDDVWLLMNLLYKFNWRYYTWKYLEEPAVSYSISAWCQHWLAVRHYSRCTTTTSKKLTFFQKVLIFSYGKLLLEPCPIVLFGILQFHLDTKHFSRVQSVVESTNITCSWSCQPLKCI